MKIIKKIVVILLIYIFIIIYYSSMKIYLSSIESNKTSKEPIATKKYDSTNINTVTKFMGDYDIYALDYFDSTFNDSKKISNQVKIKIAYKILSKESDFSKGVSSSKILIYLKSIFGNSITVKNESIKLNNYDEDNTLIYDQNNDIYIYSNNYKDNNNIELKYNYDVSFKNKKDEYILKQYKFFIKYKSDDVCSVYPSYGYADNEINMLFETNNCNKTIKKEINNYIKNNKNDLKNNMILYKYTFKKIKNRLYLEKYERN